jgi:hypothetical protein
MYSTSSILCDAIKFRSFGGALACSATSLGVECGEVDTDDAAQDCDGDHHDDGRPLSPKLHVSESKQARNEASSDRHECRPPQRGVPPNLGTRRLRGDVGENDRDDETGDHLGTC